MSSAEAKNGYLSERRFSCPRQSLPEESSSNSIPDCCETLPNGLIDNRAARLRPRLLSTHCLLSLRQLQRKRGGKPGPVRQQDLRARQKVPSISQALA